MQKRGDNMIWKNWTAIENYARNGTEDVERLISNYEDLADMLNSYYGAGITLNTITLEGYNTIPFLETFQKIESNAETISMATYNGRTWSDGSSISYADINRWEQAGYATETNGLRGIPNIRHYNEFNCGEVIL